MTEEKFDASAVVASLIVLLVMAAIIVYQFVH